MFLTFFFKVSMPITPIQKTTEDFHSADEIQVTSQSQCQKYNLYFFRSFNNLVILKG